MGAGKELLEVCLKAEQVPARLTEVWHRALYCQHYICHIYSSLTCDYIKYGLLCHYSYAHFASMCAIVRCVICAVSGKHANELLPALAVCLFFHSKQAVYSSILLHTLAYSCILLHTLVYSSILLHTLAYSCIL